MYMNYPIYKKGDFVLYEGEPWRIEFAATSIKDTYLIRNLRTEQEDADHACNFIPYIESNVQGKRYLERLDD